MSEYRFLPLKEVLKYEPEMVKLGVSQVARSPRGFLTAYKLAGSSANLSEAWKIRRRAFISRHLAQYKRGQVRRRLAPPFSLLKNIFAPTYNTHHSLHDT